MWLSLGNRWEIDKWEGAIYARAMVLPTMDRTARRGFLARAAEGVVDVVVIGGGITGAGVAREAALRDLSCLLVERADFAFGTSSRSSKLIHGGVRYLAQGDLALVKEAARERAVLRHLAPHLAEPTTMMVPVSSVAGRLKMQAGLWTFEKLAGERAGEKHTTMDRDETLAAEPGLRREHLAGSVCFTEYATDDARLVMETVKTAAAAGAMVANRAEVVGLVEDGDGIKVTVRDLLGGEDFEVRARAVVNAAGPWFDEVRGLQRGAAEGTDAGMLQLTRGIHLVFRRQDLPASHSVVLRSPDGRSTFVVPHEDIVYVGTTDTMYTGDAAEPGVSAEDTRYLLDSLAATFENPPAASKIIGTWSGVRPLLAQAGKKPSEISRRDEILVGPGPVVAVAGGKLTTYRRMAERVIGRVCEMLGKPADPLAASHEQPFASGGAEEQARARAEAVGSGDAKLDARLWKTYGLGALEVLARLAEDASARERVGGCETLTRAEVAYAVEREMALGIDDVLRRRCRVAMYDGEAAIAAADDVAAILGERFGWGDDQRRQEIERFTALVRGELDVARGA